MKMKKIYPILAIIIILFLPLASASNISFDVTLMLLVFKDYLHGLNQKYLIKK
jgi:hypothetical protein